MTNKKQEESVKRALPLKKRPFLGWNEKRGRGFHLYVVKPQSVLFRAACLGTGALPGIKQIIQLPGGEIEQGGKGHGEEKAHRRKKEGAALAAKMAQDHKGDPLQNIETEHMGTKPPQNMVAHREFQGEGNDQQHEKNRPQAIAFDPRISPGVEEQIDHQQTGKGRTSKSIVFGHDSFKKGLSQRKKHACREKDHGIIGPGVPVDAHLPENKQNGKRHGERRAEIHVSPGKQEGDKYDQIKGKNGKHIPAAVADARPAGKRQQNVQGLQLFPQYQVHSRVE